MPTPPTNWRENIGKAVGLTMAHQGVKRPIPDLLIFTEDCKKIHNIISQEIIEKLIEEIPNDDIAQIPIRIEGVKIISITCKELKKQLKERWL